MTSTGYIYKISSDIDTKVYIGQTTDTVHRRWIKHQTDARRFKQFEETGIKPKNKRGWCSYLCRVMNKYGFEHFKMETIETITECTQEKIDAAEIKYIEQYNSLSPNGYNLVTGGSSFRHIPETKKTISECGRKSMSKMLDKYRTTGKTLGLPMYVIYVNRPSAAGYALNNHPLAERNRIGFSIKKYGSEEKAKEACLAYLKELESKNMENSNDDKCSTTK